MNKGNGDKLEEEIAKPKKKKGKGPLIIIAIVLAVLLGVGGAFLFFTRTGSGKAPQKGVVTAKEQSVMFSLDPFVVNLGDQGATKFLKVSMQLELSSQGALEMAKAKIPQIRDAIINILTGKTSDDLMQPEGKLELKDEINLAANQILGNNAVKNVYFTDFVMQ